MPKAVRAKARREGRRDVPKPALENIKAVSALEREFLEQRTATDRVADGIARFTGSFAFFAINIVWYAVWIVLNTVPRPNFRPFDPFPFTFLTLMVSLEAIFLSIFVLSSQNRMARQADQRAHLDLQINMLSEQETTKTLRMLQAISDHLGIKRGTHDAEAEALASRAAPKALMRELKRGLPDQ